MNIKYNFIALTLLHFLIGCNNTNIKKQKELDLKERELLIKERELLLKDSLLNLKKAENFEKNISIISQKEKIFFVNINIEYFNTSFSLRLFQLIKYFESFNNKVISVKITWRSSDQDIVDAAKSYKELTNVPFKIVKEPSK